MSDQVHHAAAAGFEQASESYASSRPSYHPEVLDHVAESIAGGLVVDLGAGTGISTAALVDRGLDVVAVEPVDAMRERLAASVPDAQVMPGTAHAMPLADAAARAIVAAQAFHWFDHAVALDEIARVVEQDGLLVTLWNVRDESVPWMSAYTEIADTVQGDTPRYRTMVWRRAIENDPRFKLVDEIRRPNPQRSNADHTVERFRSTSFIAELGPTKQAELVSQIRDLVVDLGETYDFPYISEAQLWRVGAHPS